MARFPLWPSGMQGDGCRWPLDLLEELSGASGASGASGDTGAKVSFPQSLHQP